MMRAIQSFCAAIELIAGILLGFVMLLVVASTIGRYAIAAPIPDSFDISRLLIGACLFWGFAVVGLRGGHIQVDLMADMLSPKLRRLVDSFAWLMLFAFVCLLAWKVLDGTINTIRSNQVTYDLRLPMWPFIGLIWLGIMASLVTVATKLWLITTGRDNLLSAEAHEIEEFKHGQR
jgi:TRAP-type C4-dicarboxylate transport system permease small subunit